VDIKIFLSTFGAIFLAELGDKTQLACIMMAAQSQSPWTVFVATSAALVLVSLLGVACASILTSALPLEWIKRGAAVGFMVIGALMLWGKL
jgi:putative Ca2+/H+ antiporter (TMEM165/GDT1 family)